MPYFVFTDWTNRDTVVVLIENPAQVEHARALIAGTTTDSARIGGTVTLAPVDYNIGWSFSIAPPDVIFYDVSAEAYDADIRWVEAGVTQQGDGFLPHNRWLSWSTSLIAELNPIWGGTTADRLAGTQAHDIIFAGAADDAVAGGEGDDHLLGEGGSDRLDGGLGADKLSGGDGADVLTGGAGYDVLDGGAGLDTASYQLATAGVTVSLSVKHLQAQDTGGAGVDTLMRIENLTGSEFADVLKGSAGANQLHGRSGDDRLYGLDGNDRLFGGAGNDRLYGGAGTDRMYGGTGNDSFYVNDSTDLTHEYAGQGTDSVYSLVSHTLGANIERLYLTGTAATDGTGNDLANIITGNAAANVLSGAAGDDRLYGRDGADRLEGGAGRDLLFGGTGADTFLFGEGDLGATALSADVIGDFSQADADVIGLAAIDADTTLDGDQAFAFLGTAAFTGTAGELRFEQIDGNTYVEGDTNGDGVADFMIRLTGLHTLSADDFLL